MLKKEEKVFNKKKFTLVKLPASESILLKFELINLFGPAIGSLISLFKDSSNDSEIDLTLLGEAIGSAFTGINPKRAHEMLTQICEYCFVDGKKQPFDYMFVDSPMTDIYKVFGWVLEVNFSDFFGGKSLLGAIESKMKTIKNINEE